MSLKRVMIAAPKSGSGKTSVTIALLDNLKKKNIKTCSFKCGPDYIDPLFHQNVLGIESYNLDTFFANEKTVKDLFKMHTKGFEFAVLEGVMGLYDGLGGVREEGSSYHLAEVTDTPIILVVDGKGACKSLLALISGFKSFDRSNLIKGVILNRTSEGVFRILEPMIEEMGIKAVGFIPENDAFCIPSRHLGLNTPDNVDFKKVINILSEEFAKSVSFEKIDETASLCKEIEPVDTVLKPSAKEECVIAVSKDEAFCFMYKDNIRLLEEFGAKIVYFSPLRDRGIPKDADAILLTGGYPEEYLEVLSSNESMLLSVKEAFERKMPFVAECGGFIYLHKTVSDRENREYNLVGAIDAKCFFTGKSVRFGYIEIAEKKSFFLPSGKSIKGHEFHYCDSTDNGKDCIITKPVTGKTYESVMENENAFIGFPHLYYPSNPEFADNFIMKAKEFKKRKS